MDVTHDPQDLRRALERAQDRLDVARVRAEAARREHFWGAQPASATRDGFHAAMREEADALLALEEIRRAWRATQTGTLRRARTRPAPEPSHRGREHGRTGAADSDA